MMHALLPQGTMGYREMSESRLVGYLAGLPEIAARLGSRQALWQVRAIASGRLAQVFVVEGPSGDLCVKQALPSAEELAERRLMPPERMTFEEAALALQARFVPGLVPRVLHYDSEQCLLVMERLGPHVTLREGVLHERVFPRLVDQVTRFLAETLFRTSDLGMRADEKRERLAMFCGNGALADLSMHLAMVEPYTFALANQWTSPQLDDLAREVRQDAALKRAVAALGCRLLSAPEALLHGSLDGGALLLTETDTKVVGPSFATFGPIGFDVGTLLGHLLMSYFAQAGLAPEDDPRTSYERWLLEAIGQLWHGFHDRFVALWRSAHTGDAYPKSLFEGPGGADSLREAQTAYMRRVFEDALRFAGVEIIRRILGRTHATALERIEDPARRAASERWSLLLARELVKDAHYVTDIEEMIEVARQIRDGAMFSE